MSVKRGYAGGGEVRKGKCVGPDYAEENYENPWNVGIDGVYGSGDHRTLLSPSRTIEGMGVIHNNGDESYDSNWEHGVRGAPYKPKGGNSRNTRWTPKGKGEA